MLYVYADFDWLNETELVGELGYALPSAMNG